MATKKASEYRISDSLQRKKYSNNRALREQKYFKNSKILGKTSRKNGYKNLITDH